MAQIGGEIFRGGSTYFFIGLFAPPKIKARDAPDWKVVRTSKSPPSQTLFENLSLGILITATISSKHNVPEFIPHKLRIYYGNNIFLRFNKNYMVLIYNWRTIEPELLVCARIKFMKNRLTHILQAQKLGEFFCHCMKNYRVG